MHDAVHVEQHRISSVPRDFRQRREWFFAFGSSTIDKKTIGNHGADNVTIDRGTHRGADNSVTENHGTNDRGADFGAKASGTENQGTNDRCADECHTIGRCTHRKD